MHSFRLSVSSTFLLTSSIIKIATTPSQTFSHDVNAEHSLRLTRCFLPVQCVLFALFVDYCFIWTGEVGFHVLMNLKRAFLSSASLKAVALPSTSCLTIYLALVCTLPSYCHACHDALPIDGNCYSPHCLHPPPHPLRFIRLLALPLHALLYYSLQRIAVLVILAPLESCPVLLPISSYSFVSRYRRLQTAICSLRDHPSAR